MSNMTLFHGSPFLFDKFDLSGAGEGTGRNIVQSSWKPMDALTKEQSK